MKNQLIKIMTLGVFAAAIAAPALASADGYRDHEHREEVRSTWKGLTVGSALIGLAGLASGDRDVAIAGAIGTAYSAYRLNADGCDRERHCVEFDRVRYERAPVRYRYSFHEREHSRYGRHR